MTQRERIEALEDEVIALRSRLDAVLECLTDAYRDACMAPPRPLRDDRPPLRLIQGGA